MNRLSFAAACAVALFALSAIPTPASTPIRGATVKGGKNPSPNLFMVGTGPEGMRVLVTFHYEKITTYAYDPSAGTLNQLPQPMYNTNPNSGIGIVVKKNPGSSAARTVPLDGGIGDLTPYLEGDGTYNLVVTVHAMAINTKGSGAQNGRMAVSSASSGAMVSSGLPKVPMELVFTLQVTHGQVVVINAVVKVRTKSNQANE